MHIQCMFFKNSNAVQNILQILDVAKIYINAYNSSKAMKPTFFKILLLTLL